MLTARKIKNGATISVIKKRLTSPAAVKLALIRDLLKQKSWIGLTTWHTVSMTSMIFIVPVSFLWTASSLEGPRQTVSLKMQSVQASSMIQKTQIAFSNLSAKKVGLDLSAPFQGTTAQYRALRLFETKLIQRFLAVSNPDDLRLDPKGESRLHVAPALRAEVKILKDLMRFYVYEAPALVAQQFGQRRLVRELFEILLEASHRRAPKGILPPPFNEQLEDANTPTEKVRLAMDVIASLTEQQAVTYHARLAGSSLGLFADRIFGA
jgi:dGTP triphosphohydrolase